MGQPDHIQSCDSLAAVLISSDSEEDNDILLKTPPRDEMLRKARAVLAKVCHKVDSRHSEASAAKTIVSVSSSASEASRRPLKIQTFHSRIQETRRNPSLTVQRLKAIAEGSEERIISQNKAEHGVTRTENKAEHCVTRCMFRSAARQSERKTRGLIIESEERMTKKIIDALTPSRSMSDTKDRTVTRKRKALARDTDTHKKVCQP